MPFVSKWLMGTTIFEIGPVLSETAAAGSHKRGCNVISLHSLQSLQFRTFKVPKVLVLQLTGSNCYSKCPTTLWKGFLQRKIFLLKHKKQSFFCFHQKRSLSLSPKPPEQHFFYERETRFPQTQQNQKITKKKISAKSFVVHLSIVSTVTTSCSTGVNPFIHHVKFGKYLERSERECRHQRSRVWKRRVEPEYFHI